MLYLSMLLYTGLELDYEVEEEEEAGTSRDKSYIARVM